MCRPQNGKVYETKLKWNTKQKIIKHKSREKTTKQTYFTVNS